jgi:hypothetical protein
VWSRARDAGVCSRLIPTSISEKTRQNSDARSKPPSQGRLSAAIPIGRDYGATRKTTLLTSVPLGVVTRTRPVVAPAGTVVVISEAETTVNVAGVPLKVTLVAPVRLVPRTLTVAPTVPEVGSVSTNGLRPSDRLKTVPSPVLPL